jgi:TonB family protein
MMTTTSWLPPSVPSRAWLACLVGSLGLHVALLTMSGPRGAPASGPFVHSDPLRVALVAEASRTEPVASPAIEPAAKLEAGGLSRMPAYPKLLKFSPVDLPHRKFDENLYRPLSALTVPPTAANEISVSYPTDQRAGLLVAALTLFIDEDGTVAKVRAEAPRAPADYERAALDAFAKARFKPGMQGPTPMKTKMVIRVAFDSGAVPGSISSAGIRFR